MTVRNTLLIGTRRSRLSLIQANAVLSDFSTSVPDRRFALEQFTTKGDRMLETPLPLLGGKGVFTDEIEAALLSGDIDFAVHSLKDLPVEQREGLVIGAVTARASVADGLARGAGGGCRGVCEGSRTAGQAAHRVWLTRLSSVRWHRGRFAHGSNTRGASGKVGGSPDAISSGKPVDALGPNPKEPVHHG